MNNFEVKEGNEMNDLFLSREHIKWLNILKRKYNYLMFSFKSSRVNCFCVKYRPSVNAWNNFYSIGKELGFLSLDKTLWKCRLGIFTINGNIILSSDEIIKVIQKQQLENENLLFTVHQLYNELGKPETLSITDLKVFCEDLVKDYVLSKFKNENESQFKMVK